MKSRSPKTPTFHPTERLDDTDVSSTRDHDLAGRPRTNALGVRDRGDQVRVVPGARRPAVLGVVRVHPGQLLDVLSVGLAPLESEDHDPDGLGALLLTNEVHVAETVPRAHQSLHQGRHPDALFLAEHLEAGVDVSRANSSTLEATRRDALGLGVVDVLLVELPLGGSGDLGNARKNFLAVPDDEASQHRLDVLQIDASRLDVGQLLSRAHGVFSTVWVVKRSANGG
jgi:hypothetical protein